MCVAWKILPSLGCYVDNGSMPLKILFISISKIELWHLYKSRLPSAKGLSIYFYVESSPSYQKAPVGEHLSFACITIILHWVWMDLFYHELQCLVSPWTLKVFCIYVLRSRKGLARYHLVISYYDCFEKVLSSEIYYYCSLVDYALIGVNLRPKRYCECG